MTDYYTPICDRTADDGERCDRSEGHPGEHVSKAMQE